MYKLGILGIGNMGGSILDGILKASIYQKDEIFLFDPNKNVQEKYLKEGLNFAKNEKELVENVRTLLLAIKPQMLDELKKYQFEVTDLVVISIVAGKTKEKLSEIFGKQKYVRVMPNTPSLIKAGATAVANEPGLTKEELKYLENEVKDLL